MACTSQEATHDEAGRHRPSRGDAGTACAVPNRPRCFLFRWIGSGEPSDRLRCRVARARGTTWDVPAVRSECKMTESSAVRETPRQHLAARGEPQREMKARGDL